MNKRNFASTTFLIALLTVVLFVGVWQIKPTNATTILAEDFENWNVNGWTNITTSGETVSVATDWTHHGVCSGKFTTNASSGDEQAYFTKSFAAQTTVYARFTIKWSNNLTTNTDNIKIGTLYGSGTNNTDVTLFVYKNSSGNIWRMDVPVVGIVYSLNYINASTVYECEIFVSGIGTAGGASGLYINDVLTITQTGLDLTTYGSVTTFRVGIINHWQTSPAEIMYIDCIQIGDVYNGSEGGSTSPTFGTITANTTIAGNGVQISCAISDDTSLSAWGLAWNNTGVMVNASKITVSGSPVTVYYNGTWNETAGNVIEVQFWANDTSNNAAYSGVQPFTLTSGLYYLTVNSVNVAVSYIINGTGVTNSVIASSGSPADIQSAIVTIIAAGGGTVYVPAGVFTFNPPTNGFGVVITYTNVPINIIGAGIDVTNLTETVSTGKSTMMKRDQYGQNYEGAPIRISGITFNGFVENETVTENAAINIECTKDWRVDNCKFIDFAETAIGSGCDTGGTYHLINTGVVDHCIINNPYKAVAGKGTSWAYGIIVGGDMWYWQNMSDLIGQFDNPSASSCVYIEDSTFSRCRHAIASNGDGYYVVRHCTFTEERPTNFGVIDVHGFNHGRGLEAYNNTIYGVAGGSTPAFWIRGGSGAIFNNTIVNCANGVSLINEVEAPYGISDIYVWNNIQSTGTPFSASYGGSGYPLVENVDYFLYTRPAYTAYDYPHPLTLTSGTTNDTIGLEVGTYEVTVPSQVVSGGQTYNFEEWQDSSTDTTLTVTLTGNTTVTATYLPASVVTVTVNYPTNTTYTIGTIPVDFSASGGGTIDKMWWNCKNASSWIYVSNQTYTATTSMTGFTIGTQYTGYFWANNTDGTIGVATVGFSVEIGSASNLISKSENVYATAGNSQSKIVTTSTGDLYCVYYKYLSSYFQIYVGYSHDDGVTWTSTRISNLTGMDVHNQLAPCIAVDSNNYLHVVWDGGSTDYSIAQIWYANYTTSWSTPVRISTYSGMDGITQSPPAITVDSNNYLHIVWYGGATAYTKAQMWYVNYTVTGWSAPLRISTVAGMDDATLKYPCIVADSNNYLHVIFRGNATGYSYSQIWYTNYTTSWSTPIVISTYAGMNALDQISPALAISSNDVLYAGWHGKATGFTSNQIWIAKYDGTWQTPIRISTYTGMDGYSQEDPSIAVSTSNNAYVMWMGKAVGYSDYNKVWYVAYDGAWSTPQCLQSVWQNQYPNICWSNYPSFNRPTARLSYIFTVGTASPYDVAYDFEVAGQPPTVFTGNWGGYWGRWWGYP